MIIIIDSPGASPFYIQDRIGINGKPFRFYKLRSMIPHAEKMIDSLLEENEMQGPAFKMKYDIVHFHAEGPCSMLWIPKLFGKKCIATIHGLDHQRAKWGKFASWYIRRGEKCAVRFADEIIVLSENVQNYFLKTYGRSTVFIPNGVTRPYLVEPNRITDLYKLEKNKYILFLGRLVPEKGVHYLIKAYKALKTNKKLVIAGASF